MPDINYNLLASGDVPKFQSSEDILKGMMDMREMRRKRAIEKAQAAGLNSDGSINPTAVRNVLENEGFGGDADTVVSQMMGTRRTDVASTADLAQKLLPYVQMGLIDKDRFQQLIGNNTTVTATPKQSTESELGDTSFADMSKPQSQTGKSQVPSPTAIQTAPSEINGSITIRGQQEELPGKMDYKTKTTPAQVTPEYASDLFNVKNTPTGMVGSLTSGTNGFIKYNLPETKDRDYILQAARNSGFASKTSAVGDELDAFLNQKAASTVPVPQMVAVPGADFTKAYTQYLIDLKDYPSKVAEAKAKLTSDLEAGARNYQSQDLAIQGNKRSNKQFALEQKKQEIAQSQVSMDDIFKTPFPTAADKSTAQKASAAAKGISDNLAILSVVSPNSPRFEGARTAVAKDVIISYGLGVSEGVLGELESMVANGASFQQFNKILAEKGDLSEKGTAALAQILENLSGTKNLNTIKTLARSAQNYARNQYELMGIRDQKAFENMFPVYGETSEESNPKTQSAASVLGNKGVGKNKPSQISNQTSIYSETKRNNAGIMVGKRKDNGEWEKIK